MYIPRLEEPDELVEDEFDKLVLGGQALHSRKPSLWGRFGAIHKEKMTAKIPEDELLLGSKTMGGDEPVTLKVDIDEVVRVYDTRDSRRREKRLG